MTHDDMQSATKGDVRALEQATNFDFVRLERKLDVKFAAVQESIDQVLAVVINMNNRLTGKINDHEHRIVVLEEKVG